VFPVGSIKLFVKVGGMPNETWYDAVATKATGKRYVASVELPAGHSRGPQAHLGVFVHAQTPRALK